MTNLATKNQIPDNSILDLNWKQNYLGNQFLYPSVNTLSSGSETPIFILSNPISNVTSTLNNKALFNNYVKGMCLTASDSSIFKFYLNPTPTAKGVQKIIFTADTSGSLNSKYFTLYDAAGNGFYVWFNINSAGVDPAPPGLTAIPVAGATNASATTLGGAAATAIQAANSTLSFTASNGTGTVTITMVGSGVFIPAKDSVSAPTLFTFNVTGGLGNKISPQSLRPANTNASIAAAYSYNNFGVSANGTYLGASTALGFYADDKAPLVILDPGQSLLVTVTSSTSSVATEIDIGWFEL